MKDKYILSIHAGHNASALIGNKNGILYAIQEERLTGEKNYWGFPEQSVNACLAKAGIGPDNVERIVFGTNQFVTRYHSREDILQSYARQDTLTGKVRQRVLMPFVMKLHKRFGQKEVLQRIAQLGLDPSKSTFYDHHASHASAAYYGLRKNPNDTYLVVTCDGYGDDLSATVRVMGPNTDEVLAKSSWEDSLGALYSWTTFRMGFVPLEHEYKLMGMAPYAGKKFAEEVKGIYYKFLDLDSDGLRFKRKTIKRINDVSRDLFRKLDGKRFDAICGGLQLFTEELLIRWVSNAVERSGIKQVLASGGVFMNVKANKLVSEIPSVNNFEAFPSCGDETLIFGAFYRYVAEKYGNDSVSRLSHFYTGDEINEQDVVSTLQRSQYAFRRLENPAQEVAEILAKGHPLARCAGAMEFGARALGNRSILADPGNQDVVRVINQMVKKRDFWMPFAPMIKKDTSEKYIVNDKGLDSPYMMMTFDTRENFGELIAAVHNADLTCRAQLLEEKQNPEMYRTITEFEKLTGKSVVLNTSFNLHGYPIARNAADAMFIFENSGLRYMQLGNHLVWKDD
jgi:carbamoyltransferase